MQPDGKIIIAGNFHYLSGYTIDGFVRLNADGTIDFAFNPSNRFLPWRCRPMGKPGFVRLEASGTFDATFAGSGSPFPDNYVKTLLLQPDGKILLGGGFTSITGASRHGVVRLNADGTLDTGFYDLEDGPDGDVLALGLQADGSVVIGGEFTGIDGIDGGSIARLTPQRSARYDLLPQFSREWRGDRHPAFAER